MTASVSTSVQTSTSTAPETHILVVDDDRRLRALLSRYLKENGFRVSVAADAAEARQMLSALAFDLAVVDVMMPGENGVDLTRDLHKTGSMPILLLTAMDAPDDRINGLESGADDYLTKPFEPRELLLRITSILRRTSAAEMPKVAEMLSLGDMTINMATGIIERDEEAGDMAQLRLTTADLAMLKALRARMGEPVSREDLAGATGVDGSERTLDVQVTRLRRKIEADPKFPRYLVTVRGKGYMLQAG